MKDQPALSRREFLQSTLLAAAVTAAHPLAAMDSVARREPGKTVRPRCITMWDFSWLERRWPGAGYEDWPRVLDEARERGYDAIRIDAFPHLVATDAEKEWTLLPVWRVQDWGSPSLNRVRVLPGLHEFIGLCRDRDIKVGLSTWYREDADNTRLKISSGAMMGEQWNVVLEGLKRAGLLDTILYVDLCNEWPGDLWCPFFHNDPPGFTWGGWYTERSRHWMREACATVRGSFPELPIGFSFEPSDLSQLAGRDLSFLDFADPHLWMAQANDHEFARSAGYKGERFDLASYDSLVLHGEALYRERPAYWQGLLRQRILATAAAFKPTQLPLLTTECWAVVDYKDWPLLNWDWVKDLCRLGAETAATTGQWAAMATSNFAGPQFRGMWRDVRWHQELTGRIKAASILPEIQRTKLAGRL